MINWYSVSIIYCACAAASFGWVLIAILKKVKLNPGGESFGTCDHFSAESKKALDQSYSRIAGTLGFWKNQSEKFKRFHYYVLVWTIPSSLLIPIITQSVNESDGSKMFLTIISSFTAILAAFHRGLKVEENFKGFRNGESEFYDTYRRLLDRPESFGNNEEQQIKSYFSEVERIRKFVRNTETNNIPTLNDSKIGKTNP